MVPNLVFNQFPLLITKRVATDHPFHPFYHRMGLERKGTGSWSGLFPFPLSDQLRRTQPRLAMICCLVKEKSWNGHQSRDRKCCLGHIQCLENRFPDLFKLHYPHSVLFMRCKERIIQLRISELFRPLFWRREPFTQRFIISQAWALFLPQLLQIPEFWIRSRLLS